MERNGSVADGGSDSDVRRTAWHGVVDPSSLPKEVRFSPISPLSLPHSGSCGQELGDPTGPVVQQQDQLGDPEAREHRATARRDGLTWSLSWRLFWHERVLLRPPRAGSQR
jgi:hypothetical protein